MIKGMKTCNILMIITVPIIPAECITKYLEMVNSQAIRKAKSKKRILLSNKITPTTSNNSNLYSMPVVKKMAEIKMKTLSNIKR
jgi:hypothetical protein